jgi:hypothetical protein
MRNVSGVTGAAPIWNAFMEAVLADPRMLALLDAPADPAAWNFVAPAGIVREAIACPTGITCNEQEVFDKRWVEQFGANSGLVDSAVVASMNTVYIDRGNGNLPIGACSSEQGTTRQLLRLPVGLTRGLEQLVNGEDRLDTALVANPSFQDTGNMAEMVDAEGNPLGEEIVKRIREEQRAALAWSSRQNSPLYFGPCAQVEATVRRVFGNSVRSVSVSNYREQTANVRLDDDDNDGENENNSAVVNVSAPQQANANPSTSYGAAGVAHDSSCGGDYVLGSVYNASGQLIQAVAVVYSDDMGNRTVAAAVNGAYRFPVMSAQSSHNIYISLVDATGNPVSGTVTVPHRQGGGSDLGCHYVIWQGVD